MSVMDDVDQVLEVSDLFRLLDIVNSRNHI